MITIHQTSRTVPRLPSSRTDSSLIQCYGCGTRAIKRLCDEPGVERDIRTSGSLEKKRTSQELSPARS
ncbi:hypothetical protein NPIL_337721 [Nephila pilipes]|uniref:Uncharacterized protein n=1 Tax=Nephila pilipes TaxID=299642 RepID=A0A8X6Q1I5_NEPPI|nr:hypothetical protein NPIL_337721 [Nephila pilipes]